MKNKKILISGNAGFIGSNLTEELWKNGNEIIGIDIDTSKHENLSFAFPETVKHVPRSLIVADKLKMIWDDINRIDSYKFVFDDIDTVFPEHCMYLPVSGDDMLPEIIRRDHWAGIETNILPEPGMSNLALYC